jgi:glucose/arabinose dehydrogenase
MLLSLLALATLSSPAFAIGADQELGQRFFVDPATLPPPHATESVGNGPETVARPAGAALRVPPGFVAELVAEGLEHPRWMVVAANGDILLAEPKAARITLLRDADGDGRAELVRTFHEGFRAGHGLAIRDGFLYVGDVDGVWRLPYEPGDERARAAPEMITPPGALGGHRGHWTRNLAFSSDGSRLYVAIGSRANAAEEEPPRATIRVFAADGSGGRTFASGLRNPVGIAIRPGSDELWAVVNERDGLGDGLVPDYLARVREGAFYGWPYAYVGPNPDPDFGAKRPDLVAATVVPDVLFESHSAPLGLVFYDRAQFPDEYRGDAFVALHGSWNRSRPTGYKVVRVPFEDGRPEGGYENFAVGFWLEGEETARVWGRPAGLALGGDGSLLVADDAGGTVWRIRWAGN